MTKEICYECDGRGYDPNTKSECKQCKGEGVIKEKVIKKLVKEEKEIKEEEKKF